jgi:hypothetical protein
MKSFNLARSIKLSLDSTSQDNIFKLTQNEELPLLNPQHTILSRSKFVKNLKAYVSINSIAESITPDFYLEDSETDKLNKVLDVEWNSERKELQLLFGNDDNWMSVGESSLLNPNGYPYRIYNLLDLLTDNLAFEFSEDMQIAVKMQDVGFGLLRNQDKVNIYGSYVEEIVIDDNHKPITAIQETIVNIDSKNTILLNSNNLRKYVIIQNKSDNDIFISLSGLAYEGSLRIKPEGHYEFNTNNTPYYGVISGFSNYDVDVLTIEGL